LDLIFDLAWQCWVMPALLVLAWLLLWWRGRPRLRRWFAGLAPVGAVAVIVLGLIVIESVGSGAQGTACASSACAGGSTHWAASLAATSDLGLLIAVNGVLALLVVMPLTVVTVIVEVARLIRRRSAEQPVP
jgi:hypothetical protein